MFDAVPQDQTFIRAALRDPATRLFVDDPANPSVVALWPAVGQVAFLSGAATVGEDALAGVVRLLLERGAAAGPWLRLALPYPEWSAVLAGAFGHAFAPRERRSYTFADRNGLERCASIPLTGYEIRPIHGDEALVRDAASGADPEIAVHWRDVRELAARGIGFCAVESSTGGVASVAWSVHPPIDLVEIGVGTLPAHRGRGLSPATAGRLVALCLSRGLQPRWSTDFDNIASRRVAAKVGFGNVIEHDWPLYTPFNAQRRSIDLPEALTRDYHGRYTANNKTITIGHDGRHLRFYDQLGQTLTLAAETETRFFLREVPIQLEFTRDRGGRVDGFTRYQDGKAYRMVRMDD